MYSCAGKKHVVLILCDIQGFRVIYIDCKYYNLVFRAVRERYGHFDDVILNWHQVYPVGGATHTPPILIIAKEYIVFTIYSLLLPTCQCFLCKTAVYLYTRYINRKIVQTACMTKSKSDYI